MAKIKIKCDCHMPKCYLVVDNNKMGTSVFISIKHFKRKKEVAIVLNKEGIQKLLEFFK